MSSSSASNKNASKAPQEIVADFWGKFVSKKPGRVTAIFPRSLYKTSVEPARALGTATTRDVQTAYDEAVNQCCEEVARIKRECERTNEKFTDPDFDTESDRIEGMNNCLYGLIRPKPDDSEEETIKKRLTLDVDVEVRRRRHARHRDGCHSGQHYEPGSVHRLDWIFENPEFMKGKYLCDDVLQGTAGDCWWVAAVAAVAALPPKKNLIGKLCVAQDEACGIYGFVFQRDGEWVPVVVDDNLYLGWRDFAYEQELYDPTGKLAREHRKCGQTGSDALYFSSCRDENTTWFPLMEKAFAKMHGDYDSLTGGLGEDAMEDITGGVTTVLHTNRVLCKDTLWKELKSGQFVFTLSLRNSSSHEHGKCGLHCDHVYSILGTEHMMEIKPNGEKEETKLVRIRNPWGKRGEDGRGDWNGPWSDGSKQWDPSWLAVLGYEFGDDGVFWMTFDAMLETFTRLTRTRLFEDKWFMVQEWTTVNVDFVARYLRSRFIITVDEPGTVVIVLRQLDDRYFRGLKGLWNFHLHFVLLTRGVNPRELICQAQPVTSLRSVNCEKYLERGEYEVVPRITATRRDDGMLVEEMVERFSEENPEKLRQIGRQYDISHAKVAVAEETQAPVEEQKEDMMSDEKKGAADDEGSPTGTDKDKSFSKQGERPPWNAACVLGLLVYSQDANTAIELENPKGR